MTEGCRLHAGRLARDIVVAVGALVVSFWAVAGSGYQAAYYGLFCLLLGLPVYIWLKVGRREFGETSVCPVLTPDSPVLPPAPPASPALSPADSSAPFPADSPSPTPEGA